MEGSAADWERLVAVVLAGGSGTRLWPISRAAMPKQLGPVLGRRSLLEATVGRLLEHTPAERILTIGSEGQREPLLRQLAGIDGCLAERLWLEPSGRNTAAAVTVAAELARLIHGGETPLLVCPSDHVVRRPEALRSAVATALPAAVAGRILTFGIEPDRPETGYGYVARGEMHSEWPGVFRVRRFVEKPPRAEAERMLRAGDHLWNSGMFLMRADVLLEEMEAFAPEIAQPARRAARTAHETGTRLLPRSLYEAIPSQPIDKAVMERSRRVSVVRCDPGWSDVGSWLALWEISSRDPAGNAVEGDVAMVEASGNLVRAGERLVGLAGVRGLAVVDTPDALLVADLQASEAIRALVARLAAAGRRETREGVERVQGWGLMRRIAAAPGYVVEEWSLEPGQTCALPSADRQHLLVIAGRGELIAVAEPRALAPGSSLGLEPGSAVELRNPSEKPLRILRTVLSGETDG